MTTDTQQLLSLKDTGRQLKRQFSRANWATNLESQENSMTRTTVHIFMVIMMTMLLTVIVMAKIR